MSETNSAYPWMMFFPADHLADTGLRLCSLGARGLWTEMLCLMYEGEPHGYLCRSGKPITTPQLARLVGAAEDEVERHLYELRHNGVFSEDATGIFNRRILRDATKRERNRANGRLGGNPQLTRRPKRGVNPTINAQDKAQNPKASVQRPKSQAPEAMATPPTSSDQHSSVANVARDPDGARVAAKLAAEIIAQLNTSLSGSEREHAIVTSHRWIAKGWQPSIIMATIRSIQAREGSTGQARPLKYYEAALADAHKPGVGQ